VSILRRYSPGGANSPMKTGMPEISWPAMVPGHAARLLALLHQFEQTQWWPAERILEHQMKQLRLVLIHAHQNSAFYRRRLDEAGFDPAAPLDLSRWNQLPILTRDEVQDTGESLYCRSFPSTHGETYEAQTSGSTGRVVKVRGTQLMNLFWQALTLREHHWHHRDLMGTLAIIRLNPQARPPEGTVHQDWGLPTNQIHMTGPSMILNIATDIRAQAVWLERHQPHYLLTYPSNLAALISHFQQEGTRLKNLREVRTIGETLTPALRQACRERWEAPINDIYSSQEMGYIALQCPVCEGYHVQSEVVLVEILDDAGKPCAPGEIGRVVVSGLHNFAMPLIRYDLGDYAEAALPCPCGRGLPALSRILGRRRNLVTLPTGERFWPILGMYHFREIAPIRQFQVVQRALDMIEVRFVVDSPLEKSQEARLRALIQQSIGYPFKIEFTYLDQIPKSEAGKFEEFISEVTPMKV